MPGFFFTILQKLSKIWVAVSFLESIYIVVGGKKEMICWKFCDSVNIKYEHGGGHQAAQLERVLITFTAPLPRKIGGYLAFILLFSSSNHFTEPLWLIPLTSLQSIYYSILLASLWKLLMAVATACAWIAFTKENYSMDSCPQSKNNYHLKP